MTQINAATPGTAAVTDGVNAATAAFQELSKAYQELATKNAANLTSAIKALSSVKSPTEFMELQQKLTKDGVQAAVSDGQNIAHLTAAVFIAAFEPMQKKIEEVKKTALH